MDFDNYDERFFWFSRARTKKVEGGIKARTQRFGQSWWAAKWLQALSAGSSNRLTRGRTYARKGQITDFAVHTNRISGTVQGSADQPYEVAISTTPVPENVRQNIFDEIKQSPLYVARFLNQEMPFEIVDLFEKNGVSLFPTIEDLENHCTCPDQADPCKHIAAVFYLFSLELERDPFLLLALRGFHRKALLSQFPQLVFDSAERTKRNVEPLPADHREFWKTFRTPPPAPSAAPRQNGLLVKQLGNFPLWRGEADLVQTLEKIYAAASEAAEKYLAVEPNNGDRSSRNDEN